MSAELLTLKQAEAWLGMTPSYRGRRILRILRRREEQTGAPVVQGGGDGRPYLVARSALRRHCPHLVPSQVEDLRANFSELLTSIDTRIQEGVAEHVAEHVEPRLDELWERDETLAEAVRQIGDRVKRLADAGGRMGPDGARTEPKG